MILIQQQLTEHLPCAMQNCRSTCMGEGGEDAGYRGAMSHALQRFGHLKFARQRT